MDDLAKISDLLNELQATADRRKELLRRALTQLKIHAPRQIPLIEDIEKELSDAVQIETE